MGSFNIVPEVYRTITMYLLYSVRQWGALPAASRLEIIQPDQLNVVVVVFGGGDGSASPDSPPRGLGVYYR